ncbi:MAG: prepilin-type N-terminal cleavage/methylation domain-containing protein [Gammaproteobacteria bacterium]|nr:prepilin-type N-terminal cleavage/methylation domain-containing protein [Gammaproteobacteria bacterium]
MKIACRKQRSLRRRGLQREAQRGFTLVEMMIALTVGLVMMGGIMQIFVSSKQSYNMSDALSGVQENGRVAMDILAQGIRAAGYQGCADPASIPAVAIADNPPTTNLFQNAIRGFETTLAGWAPADLVAIQDDAIDGTDVLSIQHASNLGIALTSDMATSAAAIQVGSNADGFAAGDVLFISDCDTVDIFRATAVAGGGPVTIAHATSQNSSDNLSKPYGTGALVMRYQFNTYFIRDTGRTNAGGEQILGLFQRDVAGNVTELVEGIESMQILYGERSATSGLVRFVPGDTADLDMTEVVSLRIGLLLYSVGPALDSDNALTFAMPGVDVEPVGTAGAVLTHPKDRRLRRAFVTTINLRNRS